MDDVQRLVRRAARNVYRVVEDPDFWAPEFCLAFFEWCGVQAYELPDTVLIRGQIALELATKTRDPHTMAKAHGVMALAYRRMSLLELAEGELKTALTLAGSCSCCLANVFRCQGIVRLYQHRFNDAIISLDHASAHHRTLGNDDGVGRCLIARGVAQWRLGDTDSALKDEEAALRLLALGTPEFFYIAALTNTAAFLATGEERHFTHAESYLDNLRSQLEGMYNVTAVRMCLSWTHGLVLARLGQRKRALQMLRKARKRYLHRRQDADVLAITADIGRLYCETSMYRYLADLMRDSLEKLGDVCNTRGLLEKILHAAERELAETREHLARLRAAVEVSIPSLFEGTASLEAIAAP